MAELSSPHPQPVALETDVPLSRSVIWRVQRDFYLQRGLKVWTQDLVPNFITNNPFIAETYARIVFGFITDCVQLGLPAQTPVRILELGAGPGKFSYLFLRHLTGLLHKQGLSPGTVRYCMSDCSQTLIASWRTSSYLAEFVQAGMLEFSLLDAGEEIELSFLQTARSPLVLIANYVFDSLPQDAFVTQNGQISEALVTAEPPPQATENNQELSRFKLSYRYVPVPSDRYAEKTWNEILDHYRTHLPAATVFFPSHALKTLQALSRFSDGRMLVLAADKGFAHENALLLSQGQPALEFHAPNCFSLMVNFDAIAKYFVSMGGQALLPDKHFSNLNICGFLEGRAGDEFTRTVAVYEDELAGLGVDDLFMLLAWLNAHMEEMSVQQILAALRLSHWDPIAFMRLFPILARQLQTITAERTDLRTAVMRVWANHFPIAARENELAFQCGVVLLGLRFYEDAIAMFKASIHIYGPSATTSYNLSLCFQGLGRLREALAGVIEASNLDPDFEPARLFREKLEKTI